MNEAIDKAAELMKEIAPEVVDRTIEQTEFGIIACAIVLGISFLVLVVSAIVYFRMGGIGGDAWWLLFVLTAVGIAFLVSAIFLPVEIATLDAWQTSPAEMILKKGFTIS